jgi:hypothetical protein
MTKRRTDAQTLRRTISELLESAHAVEDSMDVFQRRADASELERAAVHFDEMLGYVDRLGEIIAEARAKQRDLTEAAA